MPGSGENNSPGPGIGRDRGRAPKAREPRATDVVAHVGHRDAPLLVDRSDQAAIILKAELSAPSDAGISSASKNEAGCIGVSS